MSSTGKGGFTIVEVTVVVVIIAILATMIVPRLSGRAGAVQLRASAQRLFVAAQYARDFSATHRCDCRLVIDSAQGRYGLVRQTDPQHQPGQFTALHGVGKMESLGQGVRFAHVRIEPPALDDGSYGDPAQDNCITFRPMGWADAAVVQITDGRRTYSMLVAPGGGQVRLVKGAVSELPSNRWDLDE